MPKKIDWEPIREAYENNTISNPELAKTFSVSATAIRTRAKSEKWERFDGSSIRDQELVTTKPIIQRLALRKIKEITEELADNYSPVDEPLIIIYAQNYQAWVELSFKLQQQEYIIEGARGNMIINPLFKMVKDVEKMLLQYAQQLGLSIASRKRIGMKMGESHQTASLFDLDAEIDSLDIQL